MSSGAKIVLFVLVLSFVAIIGGAIVLSSATQPKPVDLSTLVGDARHSFGNSDSAVTVVEYSDFQCPACRVNYPEIKRVVEKYQDKIRFIYRHFPITVSHPLAFEAAIASEIAGDQGKFWETHDN